MRKYPILFLPESHQRFVLRTIPVLFFRDKITDPSLCTEPVCAAGTPGFCVDILRGNILESKPVRKFAKSGKQLIFFGEPDEVNF